MSAIAIASSDTAVSFEYQFLPISEMQVQLEEDEKTGKMVVDKMLIKGEALQPTQRFWTSLFARYAFNSAFFKYFEHAEVFARISDRESSDRMRLCIERDATGAGKLLGVSNPTKPVVVYDELMETLGKYQGSGITYHNGIVESTHTPRIGANQFQIGGDDFANRFMLATPIDGYGGPNIYLSLLRMVCTNGMVGYSKEFKAGLAIGKGDDDVKPSIVRALDGFNNDEGYACLRQRLEMATQSWASVYESQNLYTALLKAHACGSILDSKGAVPVGAKNIGKYLQGLDLAVGEGVGSHLLAAFHKMTGDPCKLYGLANLDSLTTKRQKTLPIKCSVYDLMNFATEVSSHYATPSGTRALQGWLGSIITDEFDMENTKSRFSDFSDFHMDSKLKTGLTGSAHAIAV